MSMCRSPCTPYYKPKLSDAILMHASLSPAEFADFTSKKSREVNTWWRYRDIRPLYRCDKEYALNDLKYMKRMYNNLLEGISEEGMRVVQKYTEIETENAFAWPGGWVPQRGRVRDEFTDWWREFYAAEDEDYVDDGCYEW